MTTSVASEAAVADAVEIDAARSARSVRTVAMLTLASRVLGLARDAAMAATFGGGPVLDAFMLAFRVPNLFRRWFAEGAFAAAVIPEFVRRERTDGPEARDRLVTAVCRVTLWLPGGLVLIGWALLAAVRPGDGGGRLLVGLTAILLPYLVLICAAAQVASALQSTGRFAAAASLPIVLNLSWLGVLGAIAVLGYGPGPAASALAWGVIAAGVLQVAFVCGASWAAGLRLRVPSPAETALSRRVVRALPPIVLAAGVGQVNVVIDSAIAWVGAPAGAVSVLYFAQRLYQFPLGVLAAAVGTVLLPEMSRHVAAGDAASLRRTLATGVKTLTLLGLPAAAGLALVADPLVSLCFDYGRFDEESVARTAAAVAALAFGVWPAMTIVALQRAFFASGDRRVPLTAALVGVGVNLCGDAALLPFGEVGLAAATAFGTTAQAIWLLVRLRHVGVDVRPRAAAAYVGRVTVATAVMAVAVVAVLWRLAEGGDLIATAVAVGCGIPVFGIAAWSVGLREVTEVFGRPRRGRPPE